MGHTTKPTSAQMCTSFRTTLHLTASNLAPPPGYLNAVGVTRRSYLDNGISSLFTVIYGPV